MGDGYTLLRIEVIYGDLVQMDFENDTTRERIRVFVDGARVLHAFAASAQANKREREDEFNNGKGK